MTPGQIISFSRFVAVSAKYLLQRTSDGICMSTADATRGYRRAVAVELTNRTSAPTETPVSPKDKPGKIVDLTWGKGQLSVF